MSHRRIVVEGNEFQWTVGKSGVHVKKPDGGGVLFALEDVRRADGVIGPRQVANRIRVAILGLAPLPDPEPTVPTIEPAELSAIDAKIQALKAEMPKESDPDRIYLVTADRPDPDTGDGSQTAIVGWFHGADLAVKLKSFLEELSKADAARDAEERRAYNLEHSLPPRAYYADDYRWKFHILEMREGILPREPRPYASQSWLHDVLQRLDSRPKTDTAA